MSKPNSPLLIGQRCWTCFTIYTPHTKTTRRSFTLALAWARTCWSPTRKPSIAGFGLTRFATRTRPSPKRSRPSPITKKLGDPAGLTELRVFYCEQAAGERQDMGYQEAGF